MDVVCICALAEGQQWVLPLATPLNVAFDQGCGEYSDIFMLLVSGR